MFKGRRVAKIQRRNARTSYRKDWNDTYQRDILEEGGVCSRCGCGNSFKNPLQRHHAIPKAKGGRDVRINLPLLCKKCHDKRHKR